MGLNVLLSSATKAANVLEATGTIAAEVVFLDNV
jgi:hypothetical protein